LLIVFSPPHSSLFSLILPFSFILSFNESDILLCFSISHSVVMKNSSLSACLSIYISISLSIYLSMCLSVYQYFCVSIYPSIYLSIHLSMYPSIYPSICLSTYPSMYLSVPVAPISNVSNP
jgi:hypothetical protein